MLETCSPDPIKVVTTHFLVAHLVVEQVICDDENAVSDREAGSLLSSLGGNAAILG